MWSVLFTHVLDTEEFTVMGLPSSRFYIFAMGLKLMIPIHGINEQTYEVGSRQGSISEADVRKVDMDFSIHACWSSSSRSNSRWCRERLPL